MKKGSTPTSFQLSFGLLSSQVGRAAAVRIVAFTDGRPAVGLEGKRVCHGASPSMLVDRAIDGQLEFRCTAL